MSEPLHAEFKSWLASQRFPRELREAGSAVAGWLYLIEQGSDTPEIRRCAAEAIRKFKELRGEQAIHP